jgi:hypothetical protein
MTIAETNTPEGFETMLELILGYVRAGKLIVCKIVLEPTGRGKYSYRLNDGQEFDFSDAKNDTDPGHGSAF